MNRSGRKLKCLQRNEKGTIAVLTAITAPFLVVLAGGTVDYGNAVKARASLQTVADAALLATLSHRRASATPVSDAELVEVYRRELRQRFDRRLKDRDMVLESIDFRIDDTGKAAARVKAKVKNTFLRIVGFNNYNLTVTAEAKSTTSRTEVALVLDVTGSMGWNGKIGELKDAVREFLNTIYNKMRNVPAENFKVAVVPFSKYVNVGLDKRNASWISVYRDGVRRYKRRRLYVEWQGCVGSRDYPFNIRDDSYTVNPVPGVMNLRRNPDYSADSYWGWRTNPLSGRGVQRCQPNVIMPLRSVKDFKDQIIRRVDTFTASGWTYIPAGLAWGWRVLSPGEPYTEGADDIAVKKYNVQKIIVLMTDGDNTVAPYRTSGYAYHDHGSSNATYADRITRELCENIKATNPATGRRNAEIITITFDVRSSQIKKLMQDCSSLASFDVKKGDLAKIFDQIAEKLVDLHLSY